MTNEATPAERDTADGTRTKTIAPFLCRRMLWVIAGFTVAVTGIADVLRAQASVFVETIESGRLERTIRQSAVLVPFEAVLLHAKVSGYVTEVNVDIGDEVKKGDVLVLIDVPEIDKQLAAASAAVKTASARVERAEAKVALERARYEITRNLNEKKFRTGLELVEAEAQMKLAEAEATLARAEEAEARAKKEQVQTLIGFATIKAPFDGVITRRAVDSGALVGTGRGATSSFLVGIERRDKLKCRIEVPERDAILVLDSLKRKSLTVRLTLDALPGASLEFGAADFAKGIAHFAKSIHPESHHMAAEIDIDNEEQLNGYGIAGLFGNVEIIARGEIGGTYSLVPNTAIRAPRKGTPHVFTVSSTKGASDVKRVDIELKGTDGKRTQVTGLPAGAVVIVRGGADLQDQDRVNVTLKRAGAKR